MIILIIKLTNDVEKIFITYIQRIKSHSIKQILEINKKKKTPLLKQWGKL